MNYSVKMWCAKDENGEEIFIENAIPQKDYFCPVCGGIVHVRAKESYIQEHFYHLKAIDCDGGGESYLHHYWKENLISVGEDVYLPNIGNVKCVNKFIEYPTKDKKYRPDLIIQTDRKSCKWIIVEILNTNTKNIREYNRVWEVYGYPVYEIDVKRLLLDKSNIQECLKMLYCDDKRKFVESAKTRIKSLYKPLETAEPCFGRENWFDEKMKLNQCMSKVYKLIVKDELKNPIRINLDRIQFYVENTYVDKDTYKNFTIPFLKLISELKVYK